MATLQTYIIRCFSATSTGRSTSSNRNDDIVEMDDDDDDDAGHPAVDSDGSSSGRCRRRLATFIRRGLFDLNQMATLIQSTSLTRKPLFSEDEELSGPNERQKSEQIRILNVATECLAALSIKDPCLTVHGEPILLLGVEVKASLRTAVVYWALPFHILLNDKLSFKQKEFLHFRMQQVIDKQGGAKLQRRVSAVLRHYYPPKLHFKSASDQMMYEMLKDFMNTD
jgi:hypothetical protein